MSSRRLCLLGLIFAGIFAFGACRSLQGPADTDTFIFLDESETLFVEFSFRGNLRTEMEHPSVADYTEERRRQDYLASMQQALATVRFPLAVHLLGENEEAGAGPLLRLDAYRWDSDGLGQIELSLAARLTRYGEQNTLGTFIEKRVQPIGTSLSQLDAVYRKVMDVVLLQVLEELVKHFPTPQEEAYIEGTGY